MALSAGIIGLPNVGKSTLFNTITNSNVEAANYPFATIEPNVGIVKVPDERLNSLAKLIVAKKVTPSTCTFVDIAGLVKGASKGEGLGNKFLGNIREVDAIIHVIRCFSDKNITHYYETVDPIRDVEIVNMELIISDIESLDKRMLKVSQKSRGGDKEAIVVEALIKNLLLILHENKFIDCNKYSPEEQKIIKSLGLITTKPLIYLCNIDEEHINCPDNNELFTKFKNYIVQNHNVTILPISINMEYEISKLQPEEKTLFMQELNIGTTGLDKLIKFTYNLLGIKTFFTFGVDEIKAWSFIEGMTAPECAGIIHTDIQKGFIRAEIMNVDDLIKCKTEQAVKDLGKLRIEGKDYRFQDGDVVYFRFNVSNNKK